MKTLLLLLATIAIASADSDQEARRAFERNHASPTNVTLTWIIRQAPPEPCLVVTPPSWSAVTNWHPLLGREDIVCGLIQSNLTLAITLEGVTTNIVLRTAPGGVAMRTNDWFARFVASGQVTNQLRVIQGR